jgi:hypothetical protein
MVGTLRFAHPTVSAFRHCERSEAIQSPEAKPGLLRRFAPRNDGAHHTG